MKTAREGKRREERRRERAQAERRMQSGRGSANQSRLLFRRHLQSVIVASVILHPLLLFNAVIDFRLMLPVPSYS